MLLSLIAKPVAAKLVGAGLAKTIVGTMASHVAAEATAELLSAMGASKVATGLSTAVVGAVARHGANEIVEAVAGAARSPYGPAPIPVDPRRLPAEVRQADIPIVFGPWNREVLSFRGFNSREELMAEAEARAELEFEIGRKLDEIGALLKSCTMFWTRRRGMFARESRLLTVAEVEEMLANPAEVARSSMTDDEVAHSLARARRARDRVLALEREYSRLSARYIALGYGEPPRPEWRFMDPDRPIRSILAAFEAAVSSDDWS